MKAKSGKVTKTRAKSAPMVQRLLLADVRELILQARAGVARAVDSALTTLCWHVGQRIRQDLLKNKRAGYGKEILAALGRQLERDFGRGFAEKNLRRMVQFAAVFPDEAIVAALRRQLGWSHFKSLSPLHHPLKRDFSPKICRIENWNTRTLHQKIQSMLFERTALSKKPDKLTRQELDPLRAEDKLTPDLVFRDPYILDFLGLKDSDPDRLPRVADSRMRHRPTAGSRARYIKFDVALIWSSP